MIVVLMLIFIMSSRTPVDSDMWWHLRAGEETFLIGKPLVADLFSYTRYGETWVNHGWLGQLLMYIMYRFLHFTGLSLFVSFFAVLSFYFVYRMMDGPDILKAFLIILGAIAASYTWSPRPQIISQSLLAALSLFMFSLKTSNKKMIMVLPIFFVIWGNLHGGYVVGFIYILCFLAGECMNYLFSDGTSTLLTRNEILKISLVSILSFVSVLINPNGIQTWLIPFKTVSLLGGIAEWESPDFHDPGQQSILWLVLLYLISVFLSNRKKDAKGLLTAVAMIYLALMYKRNFGVCVVILIPEISRHLSSVALQLKNKWIVYFGNLKTPLKKAISDHKESNSNIALYKKVFNLLFVGFLGVVGFLKTGIVSSLDMVQHVLPVIYPQAGVEYLRERGEPGRMFNEYDWGGYLVWDFREQLVFMDARADLFDDEIINQWMDVISGKPNWSEIVERWGITYFVVKPDRPIVFELLKAGWKQIYLDSICTILIHP